MFFISFRTTAILSATATSEEICCSIVATAKRRNKPSKQLIKSDVRIPTSRRRQLLVHRKLYDRKNTIIKLSVISNMSNWRAIFISTNVPERNMSPTSIISKRYCGAKSALCTMKSVNRTATSSSSITEIEGLG